MGFGEGGEPFSRKVPPFQFFLFLLLSLPLKRNAMNPLSWQKRLRPLLTPVSLLYRRILAARRAKWENEGSPAFRPVCQCVSVGNIAWGGTGKTPVVDWLLGWSEARGLRAVVLSRGYKAQPPELPLHVSPSRTPGEAGDEPLMLALEHPSAAVMVDPDRRRSGRWAEERLSPDLFVLDDGFQHVKVRRDLDIVLLRPDDLGDGWGRVIPAGAWREGPEALERADVFMIKCSPEAWESLRPACERRLAGFRRPLFSFSLRPGSLRKIGTGECRDADAFAGKPYALATGVGDPAQVWETVARFMGRRARRIYCLPRPPCLHAGRRGKAGRARHVRDLHQQGRREVAGTEVGGCVGVAG